MIEARYEITEGSKHRKKLAKQIYETYISMDSAEPVNIDEFQRDVSVFCRLEFFSKVFSQAIKENLAKGDKDLFEGTYLGI
jgi:hypothetical protein